MKRKLTEEDKTNFTIKLRQFLADEFEMDIEEITVESNIIDDLGGDSILFLEMIEEFREIFKIDLEAGEIGTYMLKHPVDTVGEIINSLFKLAEKGEELMAEIIE